MFKYNEYSVLHLKQGHNYSSSLDETFLRNTSRMTIQKRSLTAQSLQHTLPCILVI